MRPSRVIALLAVVLLAGGVKAQDHAPLMADRLDGRLVQLREGRLAATPAPDRARYIAFYFGASWCGPCRAFVPDLRDAYPGLRAGGVEVVFVSDDAGCRAMHDYIAASRMPWPAVACHDRRQLAWLEAARGEALPGLLVFDANARVVASSWVADGNSRPRQTLSELRRLSSER